MPNIKVLQTVRTSCGCVAQGFLGADLTWDCDPVNETVQVIFSRLDVDKMEITEVVLLDGDAWREAEDAGAVDTFLPRVLQGESLEAVLEPYRDN
jgi:hypothetical protein